MKRIMWKPIEETGGKYEISSTGLVRSVERKMVPEDRLIKAREFNRYKKIYLVCEDGKRRWFALHRLVAQAFLANPNGLPQIDHIDENPSNNNVENLSWISASDNICKAMNVRIKCYDKINLTTEYFDSITKCAQAVGLHHTTVGAIVRGKFKNKRWHIEKL